MPMVEDWLNGLGLGKYAEAFAANDVDRRALPHLDTADLQELGVSPGHRKIMLAAIAELRGSGPEVIKAEQRALAVDGVSEPRDAEATGEPGPDVRLLSVLFCDMVGSTGLSSRFSAEEMHDLIGSYHQTVASAVTRFGGYVAKFLGDGVLVYFGWPMAYEDHAERAIRAESMLGPVPKTLVDRIAERAAALEGGGADRIRHRPGVRPQPLGGDRHAQWPRARRSTAPAT